MYNKKMFNQRRVQEFVLPHTLYWNLRRNWTINLGQSLNQAYGQLCIVPEPHASNEKLCRDSFQGKV